VSAHAAAPQRPIDLGLALLTAALDEMEPDRAADLIIAIEGRDPTVGRELRRTFVGFETAWDKAGDPNGF
jgi:hypothetical protein